MRVVGLDLSLTSTGVAATVPGTEVVEHGLIRSKATGPARLVEILDDLHGRWDIENADLVAVEHYAMGSSRQSHSYAIGELGGVIRYSLHVFDVPYVDIPPATLKKYATGKGNATKDLVLVEAVRRLGYPGSSPDEADALWLLEIGLHLLTGANRRGLPKTHVEALAKLALPEGVSCG